MSDKKGETPNKSSEKPQADNAKKEEKVFKGKVIRKFQVGSKKEKKKVYNIGDSFETKNEDVFNALVQKRRVK